MQAVADRATGQAAASPAECRVLADELRAFLREVGDVATQEARRLQQRAGGRSASRSRRPPTTRHHRSLPINSGRTVARIR